MNMASMATTTLLQAEQPGMLRQAVPTSNNHGKQGTNFLKKHF
jgi:hypothetical protein